MILVKLGGSVITDKTKLKSFREATVRRLAEEIREAGKRIILVHGAGSFGHPLAMKFQLHQGKKTENQLRGFSEVLLDVRDLNLRVMRIFHEVGIPCASLPPSATVLLDNGRLVRMQHDLFEYYVEIGVMPVTFGDVCLDTSRGFGICSGDLLIESLASRLRPERIIFCADVDGIFTHDPNFYPDAELIEYVDGETLENLPRTERCADVTGSIFGKIEAMLRMSKFTNECMVINGNIEGRLRSALLGEDVIGSRVVSGG